MYERITDRSNNVLLLWFSLMLAIGVSVGTVFTFCVCADVIDFGLSK